MSENETPSLTQSEGEPAATEASSHPLPEGDRIASTEQLLREAELKAAEHYDAWLRAKAETENVRKRAQEEAARAGRFAIETFAKALLPVKDSLEASLASAADSPGSLREGVELTLRQLGAAFAGAGLAEFDPKGEKFDPHRHQAIGMIEAEGEPNRVASVLQKGYCLHERVLRPALVMVSKAREDSASS
ncbi:MAG: nucleotide exchange factor GrpE [Rhodocyclales bacterium CG17_big_fil_post_rev_8_21_14_2_50_68_7]|nr:MAG: nucleotide exchange factor GrpE [Betaproteobacteria bacterium CG2_30_68_42]PIV73406.1 MAG: nucleotide exchange factor GrpE [Rhodocyclales bacterium CG17_big_fil_post_rev_8_21_14_2_50_68_7]PIX74951.1 MAG: nucleotide exchange factor GrpE [Rhodocyclales bacterium CG_4_10_14_3_um_filter_68_10]PJA57838.1 MAG: nucleotide exchange factor GrpE [Rhodocyclales bacterium CG_4_9_14_3_um_filter_68_10]